MMAARLWQQYPSLSQRISPHGMVCLISVSISLPLLSKPICPAFLFGVDIKIRRRCFGQILFSPVSQKSSDATCVS
jgi:hypothetical protein